MNLPDHELIFRVEQKMNGGNNQKVGESLRHYCAAAHLVKEMEDTLEMFVQGQINADQLRDQISRCRITFSSPAKPATPTEPRAASSKQVK